MFGNKNDPESDHDHPAVADEEIGEKSSKNHNKGHDSSGGRRKESGNQAKILEENQIRMENKRKQQQELETLRQKHKDQHMKISIVEQDFINSFRNDALLYSKLYLEKLDILKRKVRLLEDHARRLKGDFISSTYYGANIAPASAFDSLSQDAARHKLSHEVRAEFIQCYQNLHFLRVFAASSVDKLHRRLEVALANYSSSFPSMYAGSTESDEKSYEPKISREKYNDMRFFLEELAISKYLELDDQIARNLRKRYANFFTFNDEDAAEFELLCLSEEEERQEWATSLEIFAGYSFLFFVIASIMIYLFNPGASMMIFTSNFFFTTEYRIFRGSMLMILWMWSIVFSIRGWISARINFLYLLDLSSGSAFRASKLKRTISVIASLGTIIWSLSIVIYMILSSPLISKSSATISSKPYLSLPPLFVSLLVLEFLLVMIWTFRKSFFRLSNLLHIFGINTPSFFAAIVIDYLTSSTILLGDIANIFCYLFSQEWRTGESVCQQSQMLQRVTVPIMFCIPFCARIFQNIQRYFLTLDLNKNDPIRSNGRKTFLFIINIAKYGIALFIIIISAIDSDDVFEGVPLLQDFSPNSIQLTFYGLLLFVSLLFFAWDITIDWGLFFEQSDKPSEEHRRKGYFRSHRMYSSWWIYPGSIVFDFFMRFIWILSIIPTGDTNIGTGYQVILASSLFAICEVMRRTIWSLFRMENEQLNNRIGYRSTPYVPLLFHHQESFEFSSKMSSSRSSSPAPTGNKSSSSTSLASAQPNESTRLIQQDPKPQKDNPSINESILFGDDQEDGLIDQSLGKSFETRLRSLTNTLLTRILIASGVVSFSYSILFVFSLTNVT